MFALRAHPTIEMTVWRQRVPIDDHLVSVITDSGAFTTALLKSSSPEKTTYYLMQFESVTGQLLWTSPSITATAVEVRHGADSVVVQTERGVCRYTARTGELTLCHDGRFEAGDQLVEAGGRALASKFTFTKYAANTVRVTHPSGTTDIALSACPDIAHVFGQGYKDSTTGFHLLIACTDSSYHFYQGDKLVWTRREDLANILAEALVEFPDQILSDDDYPNEHQTNVLKMFTDRLHYQFNHFKKVFGRVLSGEAVAANTATTETLFRDRFGFKNAFAFVTSAGRLVALQSNTGHELWSRSLFAAGSKAKHASLKVLPPEAGMIHPRIFVAVAMDDGSTKVVMVDGQGSLIRESTLPIGFTHLLKTPAGVQLLDSIGKTHVLSNAFSPVSVYKWQRGDRQITGTHVSSPSTAETTWSFTAPDGYDISHVQPNSQTSPVASTGRILGDRTVWYKYLNRNAIMVMLTDSKARRVMAAVVDGISGRLLHRAEHDDYAPNSLSPVISQLHENTFVYAYPAVRPREVRGPAAAVQTVVVVGEMYQSPLPDVRRPLHSSWQATQPHVLSQAFITPHRLTAFGVTNTLNGITTKDVFASTVSGSIITFQKRLLDPRRPVKPSSKFTAEEKEEMLIEYKAVLDENPRLTLSHKRQLLGVGSVHSYPTGLESTTWVVARGPLDVFIARASPSLLFDSLGDDFSRTTLLTVMVALAGGIVVSKRVVKRRQLEAAWR